MPLFHLTVSDLRQFGYCPRIVFFSYVQPLSPPQTYKMRHGQQAELLVAQLEQRRALQRYGLDLGQRHFRIPLQSEDLALSGTPDLLIETPDQVYPVEFKETDEDLTDNLRLQLTAYSILAEEHFHKRSPRGFFYRLTDDLVLPVDTTGSSRRRVRALLGAIRRMIADEAFPPPPQHTGKCTDCEFRRFCGDV